MDIQKTFSRIFVVCFELQGERDAVTNLWLCNDKATRTDFEFAVRKELEPTIREGVRRIFLDFEMKLALFLFFDWHGNFSELTNFTTVTTLTAVTTAPTVTTVTAVTTLT
jgi:hypothetical protein